MKIIVVGGTGTIGKAVVSALKNKHEVIVAGHSQGDVQLDITNIKSIQDMYAQIGAFDALVATTGKVAFKSLEEFSSEDWQLGFDSKLMGQVNLVQQGLKTINKKGSFTLTSGILSDEPIAMGTAAAMVNGALNSFVKSASTELPKEARINIVSPTMLKESEAVYTDFFPGFLSVPAKDVAQAYVKSVLGVQTGCVYKVGW